MTPVLTYYAWTALAGALSHLFYFQRGEHHLYGVRYLQVFTGIVISGSTLLHVAQDISWRKALSIVSQFGLSYLAGLYSSILIYRVFFHPLGKFPGPLSARISSVWLSIAMNDQNTHKKLRSLHQKYGPYVRFGSSDLSITDPKAVTAIHGPGSSCIKADFYDHSAPTTSLLTFRDKKTHTARRRVWSKAFSDKMIRGYEQRIKIYRQMLIDQLSARQNQPVNIRKWLYLYGFDVMGDLAFGKSFDMLETGDDHWAIKLVNDAMTIFGFYLPMWLLRLIAAVPGGARELQRYLDFSAERIDQRMQTKVEVSDISASFISALDGRQPDEADRMLLVGDARLIISAGSDTTTTTLSTIMYELARRPEEIEKLRAELAPYVDAADPGADIEGSKIAHLDHLNAVIDEALRLYPVVPSYQARKTPPEGLAIDSVHIPGEMTVTCCQWAMGRSEAIYEKPEEFIPERWYKYPEMVKDISGYAPFGLGPFNCIGKPLALMNLRVTMARLVMTFDFKFAPGEDGTAFIGDSKDRFLLLPGDLYLTFTKRQF